MCFTFVSVGWEGSMHDTRVFYNVVMDPNKYFSHPEGGTMINYFFQFNSFIKTRLTFTYFVDKQYLVDAGYPNKKGYLAPYKGERYHFQEFNRGEPPPTNNESFNQVHSLLRSVIERTFGVCKARFAILRDMSTYDMETQTGIVGASMAIHNFIRRNTERDEVFDEIANDTNFVLDDEEVNDENNAGQSSNFTIDDDEQMSAYRNRIRDRICRRANRPH